MSPGKRLKYTPMNPFSANVPFLNHMKISAGAEIEHWFKTS